MSLALHLSAVRTRLTSGASAAPLTRILQRAAAARPLSTIAVDMHAPSTTDAPAAAAAPPPAAANAKQAHHVVLSVTGRDRPGIVSNFSAAVATHHANVEESRMAILGGDFAMIVYVSMPSADAADALSASLRSELPNFSISMRQTTAPGADGGPALGAGADARAAVNAAAADHTFWSFSLEGPDHPGIVAAVSEALATNGCNVHELKTETTTAPFAGYELFKVNGIVTVDQSKLEPLSQALDKVEDKYGSTITLIQDSSPSS